MTLYKFQASPLFSSTTIKPSEQLRQLINTLPVSGYIDWLRLMVFGPQIFQDRCETDDKNIKQKTERLSLSSRTALAVLKRSVWLESVLTQVGTKLDFQPSARSFESPKCNQVLRKGHKKNQYRGTLNLLKPPIFPVCSPAPLARPHGSITFLFWVRRAPALEAGTSTKWLNNWMTKWNSLQWHMDQ